MRRQRDTQKSRVYAAERAAFAADRGRTFASQAEVEQYVKRITATQWFERTFGRGHRFYFTPATGRYSFERGTTGQGRYTLAIHSRQRNEETVLHEIAHAVRVNLSRHPVGSPKRWMANMGASHGREYAATLLLLVQHFMGAEAAKRLRAAYRQHKVRYTKPRTLSPQQRAALAERLAGYRALNRGLTMVAGIMLEPKAASPIIGGH